MATKAARATTPTARAKAARSCFVLAAKSPASQAATLGDDAAAIATLSDAELDKELDIDPLKAAADA